MESRQAGLRGIRLASNPFMTDGERLLKLIEELVELKVELHATIPTGGKPELVRLVAKKRQDDQQRLERVRAEILTLFKD